jgi:DNA-directed RNA polymerase specialized sigma24 family protein
MSGTPDRVPFFPERIERVLASDRTEGRPVTNGEGSDAALWLEATSGTERSFGLLYDRHRDAVRSRARTRTSSARDADDVVALVFFEAWRERSHARIAEGWLLPWLLDLCDDVLRDRRRTARRWRRELAALSAAGPERHEPDATRAALLGHVRGESARRRAVLRRRFAVWGGVGLLLVGAGATAAAVIVGSRPVTASDLVYCLASPDRGADGQFRMAAASLESSLPDSGDPIAICRRMWLHGALDPGTDQLAATPAPHPVPADLQLCVMDDGNPAVLPGRPGVCQVAGLATAR